VNNKQNDSDKWICNKTTTSLLLLTDVLLYLVKSSIDVSCKCYGEMTVIKQHVFRVFAFGFDTCVEAISPLINGLVTDALLGSKKRDIAVDHWPPTAWTLHFQQRRYRFSCCLEAGVHWLSFQEAKRESEWWTLSW